MSAKDSMAKEYFADNARFADLCNNILYGGREVILPENLKERDTTEVLTALGLDKKTIAMQKLRDIFKNASIKYTGKSYVVLIGVENQSDIHYAIPVKNMFYDVMAYGNQVKETAKKHRKEKDTATSDEFLSGFTKEDKLIPVITITVYLGTKEWDGPRRLSDMFGDVDEELLPFIPDYRINLLAPRKITDLQDSEPQSGSFSRYYRMLMIRKKCRKCCRMTRSLAMWTERQSRQSTCLQERI